MPFSTVQTRTVGPRPAGWSDSVTFDQTDPALGIQSISLTLSATLTSDVAVESGELAASAFSSTDSGVVIVERPNGTVLLTATPTVVMTAALAAADGTLDYAGASGRSVMGQTATVDASVSYYPGTGAASPDAALLVGAGQVSLPVVGTARVSATGPGNLRAIFHSTIAVSVATIAETTAPPGGGSSGSTAGSATMIAVGGFDYSPIFQVGPVASMTQQRVVAQQTTGAASAISVNGFNPALGTLYAVQVSVDAVSTAFVAAENLDAVAASVTIAQTATVSVFGAGSRLLAAAAVTASTTRQLGAFDGIWDWSGASGLLASPATTDVFSQQSLYDAASLAQFTGTGQVSLGVATAGVSTINGPGNLALDAELKAGATIGVTYRYVPVPAPTDPLFDKVYYAAHNPDVVAAGIDPLAHYRANGWHEGRNPSAWFDTSYYLAQNPDVKAAGVDPLIHFETLGWKEARDPSLVFSAAKYLVANPAVRAAGADPLADFMQPGQTKPGFLTGGAAAADPLVDAAYYDRQLGATLIPSGAAAAQQAAWSYDATGWQKGLNPDAWFDTAYYLNHNPDVAAAHIDPLLHYETNGWKEGRDPSAQFSTNKYLAAYSDVKAAGMDPLVHFVVFGQGEGRAVFAA